MKMSIRIIFLILNLAASVYGTEIKNDVPEFKFKLPVGFQRETIPPVKMEYTPLFGFVRAGEKDRLTLRIMSLNQEIPQLPPEGETILKAQSMRLVPWGKYKIGVRLQQQGDSYLALALIPLQGEAVSFGVEGDISNRAEVEQVLMEVLATLEGPASWRTNSERIYEMLPILLYSIGGLGIVIIALYLNRTKKNRAQLSMRKRVGLTLPPAASGIPSVSSASSAETHGRNDSGT